MARGWTDTDPDKGAPHRHTRAKVRLLLTGEVKRAWLVEMLIRMSERHPDAVLGAVSDVLAEHEDELPPTEEFRRAAADFIARNEGLLTALADDGIPVTP